MHYDEVQTLLGTAPVELRLKRAWSVVMSGERVKVSPVLPANN
jgi:hypothetical protein